MEKERSIKLSGTQTKVLFVIDSLTCGGGEKSLTSAIPFLLNAGCDVSLGIDVRGGVFERLLPEEVNVFTLPRKKENRLTGILRRAIYGMIYRMPWNRNMHRAEFFWQSFGGSYQKLQEHYDVAIGYQQGLSTYYVADKVNADRKICWINADIEASRHLKGYCRKYYARFDNIVMPSEILLSKMAKSWFIRYPERLVCINDIINPKVIGSLSQEFTPFAKTGSCIHLTTVGRLVKEKGYNLLLDAAEILRNSGVEFQWHIIGAGPLKEELEQSIDSKNLNGTVILEGLQTNPYPYIADCDIYVQTSIHEGFGITIGEAKVLHKPIVCTNFPVIYDQLQHHVNGIIVEMNGESIANGIKELLSDSLLGERMIRNLRQDNNTSVKTESLKLQKLILDGKSTC